VLKSFDINIKELILEAITNYNKYRSPEATAKLIALEKSKFRIEFSGSFCHTCGVDAYFEDLIYELTNLSNQISVEMTLIRQTDPESYEVDYGVSSTKS